MSPQEVRLPDPDLLQRCASDPAVSAWVGASAGTGKTKVLTDRVLRLMLAGTPPHRILCLTFTKAAAAEMANRINRTLGLWATAHDAALEDQLAKLTGERPSTAMRDAARRLFARVVDCPGGMKLQTIHAFCQSLLRRFPLEAGLAPRFETMDERTAAELLDQARGVTLTRSRHQPESALGLALKRLSATLSQEEFAGLMAELVAERGRLRRIFAAHGGLDGTIAAVWSYLELAPGTDGAAVIVAACADEVFDADGLRRACGALARGTETDQKRGVALGAWLASAPFRRAETFDDHAALFLTEKGEPRKILITKKPAEAVPGAAEALHAEALRLVVVRERRRSAEVAMATVALLTYAEAMDDAYAALKRTRALLDYDDLILATRDLLTRPGVAPWVLFKLDGGLDHILIDEAQDTNPEQWQVVAALAEEFFAGVSARPLVRTVFAVGDEKQSIFSFQRADPAEFARMRRHFAARVVAADRKWTPVDLNVSFRSTAAVLATVDAVFARPEARDGVIEAGAGAVQHFASRRGQAGLVELWPPVAPGESAVPESWAPPLVVNRGAQPQARLATAIADTIAGWLQRGERLESCNRPIRPGDIMVLVRRRTSFVNDLVRALKERDVAVAGADRLVLTEHLAVMDLIALAEFLLLPEDDLILATVLKGPLIGLAEEDLFTLAWDRSGRRLWAELSARAAAGEARFLAARRYLAGLLAGADFVAPYELFAGVLDQPCPADAVSGRRAILARLGQDARDPLDEFLALCLAFQRVHPPSLQEFPRWLAASRAVVKREQEQDDGAGGGKVRVMTIHGAKGLQAPIVFMPDTLAVPTQGPRVLWPETSLVAGQGTGQGAGQEAPGGTTVPLFAPRRALEDRRCAAARAAADLRRDQEYRRLLYVALTRAEDRLYICGWRGEREPASDCWYRLIQPALAGLDGCVEFDFVQPGAGGWEGKGLRFHQPQTAPTKDDWRGASVLLAAAPLPVWWNVSAPDEPDPPRPLSPSRSDDPDPPARSPLGDDQGAGFRRGLIVHQLLQTLPDLAPELRAAACRRTLSRPGLALPAAVQESIATETLAVLNHGEFAPLFGPGSRAEVPVVGVVAGRALSGRIDRLLVGCDSVWIVDYKTLRPVPVMVAAVAPAYLRQMALYRAALAEIYPDRTVRCVLVWTDGPQAMELPPALLDQALTAERPQVDGGALTH
ncbi:ATP-dependent helicase/nuclease subunit A [uncultured Gammaproteobacteria bacterium]